MKKKNLLHSDEASSLTPRQKILLLSTFLQVDVENCQLTTSAKWQTTSLIALRACLSWWAAAVLDFCARFALRAPLKVPAPLVQTGSSFGAPFAFQHLPSHLIHQGWGLDGQGQKRGRQSAIQLKQKSLFYTKYMQEIFCLSAELSHVSCSAVFVGFGFFFIYFFNGHSCILLSFLLW